MTKPPYKGAAPIELVLAGKAGLHRGRIAHDFRSRIVSIAPAAATQDRPTVLSQCGDDERVADTCLTGNEVCRYWLSQRPGAGDNAMRDVLISLWHPLHETEAVWRCGGEWMFADNVNVEARATLLDSMTLYLHMFGYEKATPVLGRRLWTLVRAGGEHRATYFMRASGVALLDDDGDEEHPDIVPHWDPLDPLGIAEIYAQAHLKEPGAGLPKGQTHAEEMDDDRAGIVRHSPSAPKPVPVKPVPASELAPQGSGVVIFPANVLDAHATAEGKRDVKAALGAALDKPLALTPVPEDWNAWEAGRLAISPWGGDAFRAIREGQAGRTHIGRDVICFVGPAGAGKSHLVREAAESLGVPFARFGADSATENSFAGTNARYTTKHLGFVENAMARHRHAGPMILVEELEKAAGTRHSNGGRLHDCLHSMWEPETCGDWHSAFLLHPVSLAHVPFVCTANSLDGLPTSLLDRMKIVRVPEPGPEHLGVLAPRLARAVCRETGQDERFGDLDGDELSALADAWRGGSIRRLRRLVEVCLRSRESGPAAMPRH